MKYFINFVFTFLISSIAFSSYADSKPDNYDHGFLLYYYTGDYRDNPYDPPTYSIPLINNDLISGSLAQHNGLMAYKLIAKTKLVVHHSGKYLIFSSTVRDHDTAEILLNGIRLFRNEADLKADNIYDLDLIYTSSNHIPDLSLSWIMPGEHAPSFIPIDNLIFPLSPLGSAFHKNHNVKTISYIDASTSGNHPYSSNKTNECKVYNDLKDSSCNGIPDDWSLHGYTTSVDKSTGLIALEKWDDKRHSEPKNKKYFSAVYKYSTADDPFSDYQKVTGIGLDKAVDDDARNPLVAAVPAINIKLEKVIISRNNTITQETSQSDGNTLTLNTNDSVSKEYLNNIGGSVSGNIGLGSLLGGGGVTIGATYNHQLTDSTTISKEKGSSSSTSTGWSKSLSMNTADSAYFYPIVRYENVGTAPAYELTPTSNFVIARANNSKLSMILKTITAKPNTVANALMPNKMYPDKSLPQGVMISAFDDYNQLPIRINKQQLDLIESGGIIYSYSPQYKAKVKYFNEAGRPLASSNADNDWSVYLTQIQSTTAQIRSFIPGGEYTKERFIAARDPNVISENISKPDVTVTQALDLMKIKYDAGTKLWSVFDKNKRAIYTFSDLKIILADDTLDEIKQQPGWARKDFDNLYLRPKMLLYVCPQEALMNKSGNLARLFDNCSLKTGFQDFRGSTYYFDTDGKMVTGWKKIDGSWYYFGTDGKKLIQPKGWQEIDGSWYYLDTDGKMMQHTGRIIKIEGSWYYLDTDGKRTTDWKKIDGSLYYFGTDGKMMKGWQDIEGSRYYLDTDGKMMKGWQDINGSTYYLGTDGKMLTGTQYICPPPTNFDIHGCLVAKRYTRNYPFFHDGRVFILLSKTFECPKPTDDDGIYGSARHCLTNIMVYPKQIPMEFFTKESNFYLRPLVWHFDDKGRFLRAQRSYEAVLPIFKKGLGTYSWDHSLDESIYSDLALAGVPLHDPGQRLAYAALESTIGPVDFNWNRKVERKYTSLNVSVIDSNGHKYPLKMNAWKANNDSIFNLNSFYNHFGQLMIHDIIKFSINHESYESLPKNKMFDGKLILKGEQWNGEQWNNKINFIVEVRFSIKT